MQKSNKGSRGTWDKLWIFIQKKPQLDLPCWCCFYCAEKRYLFHVFPLLSELLGSLQMVLLHPFHELGRLGVHRISILNISQNIQTFVFLDPGLWIRIHFFRIRSMMLETNTDPDPDPIRIQGFNDQKLKKNYSWKFFFIFIFFIKNCNLPIPRPPLSMSKL